MYISILSDEYLPLGTRAHSRMLHELAIILKKRGHRVVVITPGNLNQQNYLVTDLIDDIEIWRFKSDAIRGQGMALRLKNEFLLSRRAWKAIAPVVYKKPFDLCINYSPSIFFGPLAKKLKKNNTFIYLILRDMFPQWAIDSGLLKSFSPIALFLRYFERLNYQTSDWIGLQSKKNLEIFKRRFPSLHFKSDILFNWSTPVIHHTKVNSEQLKLKLGIKKEVVFFYGGNIGYAQDMTNIMKLARGMSTNPKCKFVIVGQGDEFKLVKRLVHKWKLTNTIIMPSVSQADYFQFLEIADIGLFSLSKKHSADNFPGKILGYMSSSLPILGSVNPSNDLIELINKAEAGYVFVNGEDELLLRAARKLAVDIELRKKMSHNSMSLLVKKFSTESAASKIISIVLEHQYAEK